MTLHPNYQYNWTMLCFKCFPIRIFVLWGSTGLEFCFVGGSVGGWGRLWNGSVGCYSKLIITRLGAACNALQFSVYSILNPHINISQQYQSTYKHNHNHKMQSTKSTYGLCTECISKGGLNLLESKKPDHCTMCKKEANVLLNQDPYCTSCYIQTVTSPGKSDMSSQKGHQKTKAFFRPIDKEEVKNMKKSFLSNTGKLIKKISKVFEENEGETQLLAFLNKKGVSIAGLDWQKFVPKITKASNIIYIFIGKTKIIGAFHTQSINIEGEASVWDQESGIFFTDRNKIDLEFGRVKADMVLYSCKGKMVKFGAPSSFQISFEKGLKVYTELVQDFQCVYSFVYRP